MKSLIAILSFNRPDYLYDLISSLGESKINKVIFDDGSDYVPTMTGGATLVLNEHGGVARNSNRAIQYFKNHPEYQVMFLCNDDLTIDPTVFGIYIEAIKHTGYQHFCYTDKKSLYRPSGFEKNGVQLSQRRTGDGCFITITRKMVDQLGGFDVEFGVFGGEHLDYSRRAEAAGFCEGILDVVEARDYIKVRQYHEDVPRALGRETNKYLDRGREYWLETLNEEPIIWKPINC